MDESRTTSSFALVVGRLHGHGALRRTSSSAPGPVELKFSPLGQQGAVMPRPTNASTGNKLEYGLAIDHPHTVSFDFDPADGVPLIVLYRMQMSTGDKGSHWLSSSFFSIGSVSCMAQRDEGRSSPGADLRTTSDFHVGVLPEGNMRWIVRGYHFFSASWLRRYPFLRTRCCRSAGGRRRVSIRLLPWSVHGSDSKSVPDNHSISLDINSNDTLQAPDGTVKGADGEPFSYEDGEAVGMML